MKFLKEYWLFLIKYILKINITLGKYVTTINQITSVTIGSGITSIDNSSFNKSTTSNPNLTSITIDKSCSDIKNNLLIMVNNYYP